MTLPYERISDLTTLIGDMNISHEPEDVRVKKLEEVVRDVLKVSADDELVHAMASALQQKLSFAHQTEANRHNSHRRGRSPARPPASDTEHSTSYLPHPPVRNRSMSPFQFQRNLKNSSEKKQAGTPSVNNDKSRHRSRTMSPSSARPGLEEEDDMRDRISGKSPARNERPSTPSREIDSDDTRQPLKPRSFSKSPLRRPGVDTSPGATSSFQHNTFRNDFPPKLHIPDIFKNSKDMPAPRFANITNEQPILNPQPSNKNHFPSSSFTVPFAGGFSTGSNPTSQRRTRRQHRSEAAVPSFQSPTPAVESFHYPTNTPENPSILSPMELETPQQGGSLFHPGARNPGSRVTRTNQRVGGRRRNHATNSHHRRTESGEVSPKDITKRRIVHPKPVAVTIDPSGTINRLEDLREQGKQLYQSKMYRESIKAYTDGIKMVRISERENLGDLFSILLSNRAAALVMLDAHVAAVQDCKLAIQFVSSARPNVPFSRDKGIFLRIRLLIRLARATLRCGNSSEAVATLNEASSLYEQTANFINAHHSGRVRDENLSILSGLNMEVEKGISEANQVEVYMSKAHAALSKTTVDKAKVDALGYIDEAIRLSPASEEILELKVQTLGNLRRWREAAGFCERYGALAVRIDFLYDLDIMQPSPGLVAAKSLSPVAFNGEINETALSAHLTLCSASAVEVMLRLPYKVRPIYARALRLEERYPAADSCLRQLESVSKLLPTGSDILHHFSWVATERKNVTTIRTIREQGDDLYQRQKYLEAARMYSQGFGVDMPQGTESSGGRVHAVLHCNRAACLLASSRFKDAIQECSSALRIHPQYMKALLRRARSHHRIHQYKEAISDLEHYLNLVDKAQKNSLTSTSYVHACLFDGPREVTSTDIDQVKRELHQVQDASRHAERTRRAENTHYFRSAKTNHGPEGSAYQRRAQYYEQHNDARFYDSFSSRGPRKHQRSHSWNQQRGKVHNAYKVGQRDSYAVLGLATGASMAQVKKAYKLLCLKYHPDKNKEEGASDTFLAVKQAYEEITSCT